jgi:IMP dehydrogenase/GMP reductase
MNKFVKAILLVVGIMAFGALIGWMLARSGDTQKTITDQTILTALRERGFLVTETIVSTVATNIKTDQASIWKRLFWGQEIQASAVAEVNLGVDLEKMSGADIKISSDKITVEIPGAEIFNSRLVGEISVINTQGILKRVLQNDDGYNQAMAELIKQAESAATSTEMMAVANDKAKEEIKRLVGYMALDKDIIVVIKQ